MNSDFCLAVHAMVYLNHKNDVFSSEQLSENICTHPARVRRVLSKLRKSNLLDTMDCGPKGGYRFVGDPQKITLSDIAKALKIQFIETGWHSGNEDMDCIIASRMGKLMDNVFKDLNEQCHSRLKKITISDINDQLFGAKSTQNEKEYFHENS